MAYQTYSYVSSSTFESCSLVHAMNFLAYIIKWLISMIFSGWGFRYINVFLLDLIIFPAKQLAIEVSARSLDKYSSLSIYHFEDWPLTQHLADHQQVSMTKLIMTSSRIPSPRIHVRNYICWKNSIVTHFRFLSTIPISILFYIQFQQLTWQKLI